MKKTLDNEVDDTWRRKGHIHEDKDLAGEVCSWCQGYGTTVFNGEEVDCEVCGGLGEIL